MLVMVVMMGLGVRVAGCRGGSTVVGVWVVCVGEGVGVGVVKASKLVLRRVAQRCLRVPDSKHEALGLRPVSSWNAVETRLTPSLLPTCARERNVSTAKSNGRVVSR